MTIIMAEMSSLLFAHATSILPSADNRAVVFCNGCGCLDLMVMLSPLSVKETPTLPCLIQIASIATAIAHRSNHLPDTILPLKFSTLA